LIVRSAGLRSVCLQMVAGRLLSVIPVLFGVSLFTFWVFNLLPGNAAQVLLGPDAAPQQVAQLEAELELDRPFVDRYLDWFGGLLRGNLGRSISSGQSVVSLLIDRWPVTAQLVLFALLISVTFGLVFGLMSACRPGQALDRAVAVISMAGLSVPNYVLAVMLVLLFSVKLGALPSIGYVPASEGMLENISSLTLPAIALAFPFFSLCTRFFRGDLLEQMHEQRYIVTARAKGFSRWQVLVRHGLRNSLFGVVTLIGLNIGALIGGTVIIEQIFALPGVGQLLLQAAGTRDVVVVQAIVLLMTMVTVIATLCVDISYILLDPRIRNGSVSPSE
jgi:peptide/nickel transport system permease protein